MTRFTNGKRVNCCSRFCVRILTFISLDELLLLKYINWYTNFWRMRVSGDVFFWKYMYSILFAFTYRPMHTASCSMQFSSAKCITKKHRIISFVFICRSFFEMSSAFFRSSSNVNLFYFIKSISIRCSISVPEINIYCPNVSPLYRLIGQVGKVFANGLENMGSIPGQTLKMVLDVSLLNYRQYKVRIKGRVEQSRERSGALPYTSV